MYHIVQICSVKYCFVNWSNTFIFNHNRILQHKVKSIDKYQRPPIPNVLQYLQLVMKKSQQTYLLDTAHKWAVRTLMGLTVVGCITFGLQMYNYINYVKPVRAELWRKNKENEVALEQQEKELELLRRQKAAEGLMES